MNLETIKGIYQLSQKTSPDAVVYLTWLIMAEEREKLKPTKEITGVSSLYLYEYLGFTTEEVDKATGLSHSLQRIARIKLEEYGLVDTTIRGKPRKVYVKTNRENLEHFFETFGK